MHPVPNTPRKVSILPPGYPGFPNVPLSERWPPTAKRRKPLPRTKTPHKLIFSCRSATTEQSAEFPRQLPCMVAEEMRFWPHDRLIEGSICGYDVHAAKLFHRWPARHPHPRPAKTPDSVGRKNSALYGSPSPFAGILNPGPRDHFACLSTVYTGCRSKRSLIALPTVRGHMKVINKQESTFPEAWDLYKQ